MDLLPRVYQLLVKAEALDLVEVQSSLCRQHVVYRDTDEWLVLGKKRCMAQHGSEHEMSDGI